MDDATQEAEAPAVAMPRTVRAIAAWWPLVLPPVVMAAVWGAHAAGARAVLAKTVHETIALMLLSAAVGAALKGLLVRRDRASLLLALLCIAFLCREIHFRGTDTGFYVAVALIAAWAALWRKDLLAALIGQARGRWLVITAWAYFLSLLVQRRALRFLPGEDQVHVQLEEISENLGHLLLAILALL